MTMTMMTVVMTMMRIIVINIILICTNHSGTFNRGRSLANVAVAFLQPEIPGDGDDSDGDDDGISHDDDDDFASTTRNARRAIKCKALLSF